MREDIEVGDYVRTRNGKIRKVKSTVAQYYITDRLNISDNNQFTKNDIVKHSKNIIDLIEVGDFVNGYRVLEMFKFQNDKYAFTICKSDFKSICRIWSEEDIETTLTKEQYSQNCYTVERR